MSTPAILIDRVTKRFGDVNAVNNLSLTVGFFPHSDKDRPVAIDKPLVTWTGHVGSPDHRHDTG